MINTGFKNVIPILDNKEELMAYKRGAKQPFRVGIRVAAEEEPNFPFYTSRLGIRAKDILEFYVDEIEGYEDKFQLKMLHIFLNKGIKDDIYYWSELNKIINLYCQLKKICPELDSINIGGGFPIKHSLGFEYDYQFIINEIVSNIKKACKKAKVPMPNIYTEFGSYTVGESMAHIYKVLAEKKEFVLSRQMLRSGTSIGANIREAEHAQSRADFIHKLSIAQKECDESMYWLELLKETEYISKEEFDSVYYDCEEVLKITKSIIITSKK